MSDRVTQSSMLILRKCLMLAIPGGIWLLLVTAANRLSGVYILFGPSENRRSCVLAKIVPCGKTDMGPLMNTMHLCRT